MAVLGNNSETLLTGLSSFWQTLFKDRDQLQALYAGTEVLLGQVYLDMVSEVLNVNLDEAPLFNREYWHALVLREDQLMYDPDKAAPYYYELEDTLVDAHFLLNRIYDPTWSWEKGTDFEVDRGVLRFYVNPFTQSLPGVARRQIPITATQYRTGVDGNFLTANASRFEVDGLVRRGDDGELGGTDRLASVDANFTKEDVGRTIKVEDPSNPGTTLTRTIDAIIDDTTVRLDATIAGSGTNLPWVIYESEVFFDINEGDVLVLQDPNDVSRELTYVIDTVESSNLAVTTTEPIDFSKDLEGISWTLQSPDEVEEISMWIPDGFFDRENLYLSFGYLIDRYEPSSESYRRLLQAIFQFFILGPALQRVESALNVMVGIPVVENDGEEVLSIFDRNGNSYVETNNRTYELPLGSVRDNVTVGAELEAFHPLTDVFTVTDYIEDPDWFYGRKIPEDLIFDQTLKDRSIDADPYDAIIGSKKFGNIGDPRTYIGADYTGKDVPQDSGLDAYVEDPSLGRMRFKTSKVLASAEGALFTFRGYEFEILDTGLLSEEFGYVDLDVTSSELSDIEDRYTYFNGFIPYFGGYPIFEFPNTTFDHDKDPGTLLDVSSDPDHTGLWKITQVISETEVRVEPFDVPGDPDYGSGASLQATHLFPWRIETRTPIKHNVGYVLMQDYLKQHICFVTYDFNKYDVPYPRAQADIQNVLLEGKPAHVYMLIAPENRLDDETVLIGEPYTALGFKDTDTLSQTSGNLVIGGNWSIGSYYGYSNPTNLLVDTVRFYQMDGTTKVELQGADQVNNVYMSPNFTGGDNPFLEVSVYTWDGSSFVFDQGYALGPGGGQSDLTYNNAGVRTAVEVAVASGDPDIADLEYSLVADDPSLIVLDADDVTSTTGQFIQGQKFEDVNFSFHNVDVGRQLIVDIGTDVRRYLIEAVWEEHIVILKGDDIGPSDTVFEWRFGSPLEEMTPLVVGSDSMDINSDSLGDWPAVVAYDIASTGLMNQWTSAYGPTILLPLDEESGTIAKDVSGNGNDFTINGNNYTLAQDGPYERDLDGIDLQSNDYLENLSMPAIGPDHTVSIAANLDGLSPNFLQYFVDSEADVGRVFLISNNSGQLIFRAGNHFISTDYVPGAGPMFITGVSDSSTTTGVLNVNGLPVTSGASNSDPVTQGACHISSYHGSVSGVVRGIYSAFSWEGNAANAQGVYQRWLDVSSEQRHYYKEEIVDALGITTLRNAGNVSFHLPLWEEDGNQVIDVSMNGLHFNVNNTPTLGAAPLVEGFLYSVITNGGDLRRSDGAGFDLDVDDRTVAFAVSYDTDTESSQTIWIQGDVGNYLQLKASGGTLEWRAYDGTTAASASNAGGYDDNQTHGVVGRWNASTRTLDLWVDGSKVGTDDASALTLASSAGNELIIGGSGIAAGGGIEQFQHLLDYDGLLSDASCAALSNITTP